MRCTTQRQAMTARSVFLLVSYTRNKVGAQYKSQYKNKNWIEELSY